MEPAMRSSSRKRKPTLKCIDSEIPRSQNNNSRRDISCIDFFPESTDTNVGDLKNNNFHVNSTKSCVHYTQKGANATLKKATKSQIRKKYKPEVDPEHSILKTRKEPANSDVDKCEPAPEITEDSECKTDFKMKSGQETGLPVASNAKHDVKAVKKCTVRVLLKNIIQDQRKAGTENNEKVEAVKDKRTQTLAEQAEQSLEKSNMNVKRRRGDAFSASYDKVLTDCNMELKNDNIVTDALENVVKQRGTMFKEDGSLVEVFESDPGYKQPKSSSKTCLDRKKSTKDEEISDRNEFSDEYVDNEDEDIPSDIEAQIKIEFDEFAESAEMEEVDSDFDEKKPKRSMACPVCSKVLSNQSNLNKHVALHGAEKPFQCEVCGMSFAIQAYLKIHSVIHSGNCKHKCDTCGKRFLRRSNLNTHQRTHTDVKAFSCGTCDKKFKSRLGRDSHMKEHVKGPLAYKCDTCGKSFNQQSYLQRHISVHKGEKPYQCLVCEKSFPYKQSLQEHMRRHTGEKPEICDQCNKGFNNKRQLKVHMKYHNTVSEFACMECNMFYDSQQSLNKHITKSHNRKHECDYCKQSFVNKKHLRTHQAIEHKELLASSRRIPPMNLAKARKVKCTLCHRVFFNRYVLSKHLMSKHQLSEKEMKELLQIRKKAVSKRQVEKYKVNDMKDVSKLLENDKSFRVYYKDDEMAVYVKGTDDFVDSGLKGINEGSNVRDIADVSSEDVRYVVYGEESGVANDLTGYTDISSLHDPNEAINLTESVIQSIQAVPEEEKASVSGAANNEFNAEIGSTGNEGQNYYVVFTDSNENSESTVKVFDNKLVSQAEIHNINDNETERIVLILNEGEVGKNVLLENGEQYEIVTDNTDLLQEVIGNPEDEYEVVAAGPVMLSDQTNNDESSNHKSGNVVEGNGVGDTFVSSDLQVGGRNLPLLEQLQTQNTLQDMGSKKDKNERVEEENITKEMNVECQTVEHCTDDNEMIDATVEIQCQGIHIPVDTTSAEEGLIVIPAATSEETDSIHSADNNQVASFAEMVNSDCQISRSSLEKLVPNSSTAQEFANFENAVKAKVEDFQNQEDYNDFLDKMIQTLQKAKHREPQ